MVRILVCAAVKSSWAYPLESHLHELMLQSPHRTLDPEVGWLVPGCT
jgi:hypothetical protein